MALFRKRLEGVTTLAPDGRVDDTTIEGYCRTLATCVDVLRSHLVGWPKEIVELCATYLKRYTTVRMLVKKVEDAILRSPQVDHQRARFLVVANDCVCTFGDDQDLKTIPIVVKDVPKFQPYGVMVDPTDDDGAILMFNDTRIVRVSPHTLQTSTIVHIHPRGHIRPWISRVCISPTGSTIVFYMPQSVTYSIVVGTRRVSQSRNDGKRGTTQTITTTAATVTATDQYEWAVHPGQLFDGIVACSDDTVWIHRHPDFATTEFYQIHIPTWTMTNIGTVSLYPRPYVRHPSTGRFYFISNDSQMNCFDPQSGVTDILTDPYLVLAQRDVNHDLAFDHATGDLYATCWSQIVVVSGLDIS